MHNYFFQDQFTAKQIDHMKNITSSQEKTELLLA
jgi:hypothetical protein